MKSFVLTDTHIKLLRAANVDWWALGYGAPCIDPKRPYGNSAVISDIINITGLSAVQDENGKWQPVIEEAATRLHCETETALQIILMTGRFEPGTYQADDYSRNWRKVEP